ncbi:ribonuclease Z [Candidatus Woesearchaeota archaeon]|jgi:ribonuclease Z|nr:ribonuclease Z [Candidatus Woesearchaeota archaeon]MBT3537290.1 ribonuclease Z [Candidatus Woesearchaeota archaeon]MBT4696761.1 ribonuclease Z [Candidatus Woesearchaeota archaeon]MBT4716744.1 ribonuclease Z [Candidatus Woesearchaeota archaeon]MBT7106400.1 ribonuclease Z [Candidatus Woesearchaeota archaeon]
MQITLLGTSCMVPTKERNVAGIFLQYKSEGLLFDCGEGTQRQMNITGIKRTAVTKILITHWHGDHVSGLLGLMQTKSNSEENPRIDIWGPRDTKMRIEHLMKATIFSSKMDIRVYELDPKGVEMFYENEDYYLECAPLEHGLPCIGYSFVSKDRRRIDTAHMKKMNVPDGPHLKKLSKGESITYKGTEIDVEKATYIVEGKKFTYVADTEFCPSAVDLAENADVVVCEATYESSKLDKAEGYKHMTAQQAGLLANQAGAKKLVLNHFSQRYKEPLPLIEDARTVFDNVVAGEDFMKIRL